jgi:hypothetical protein
MTPGRQEQGGNVILSAIEGDSSAVEDHPLANPVPKSTSIP